MDMTKRSFDADNGITILIETTTTEVQSESPSREWSEGTRGSVGSFVRKAKDEAIEAAFEAIQSMGSRTADLVEALQQQNERPIPASIDVEFGVSFNGELQAYIAKASAEGTISVKLSWELRPKV